MCTYIINVHSCFPRLSAHTCTQAVPRTSAASSSKLTASSKTKGKSKKDDFALLGEYTHVSIHGYVCLCVCVCASILCPHKHENIHMQTDDGDEYKHLKAYMHVCMCLKPVCLYIPANLSFKRGMHSKHEDIHIQTDDEDDDASGVLPPPRKTSAATAPAGKTETTVKKPTAALKSESISSSSSAKEKDAVSKASKSATMSSKGNEAELNKHTEKHEPKLASHSSGQCEESASANRGKQIGSGSSKDANKDKHVLAGVDAVAEHAAAVMGWAQAVCYSLGCTCVHVCAHTYAYISVSQVVRYCWCKMCLHVCICTQVSVHECAYECAYAHSCIHYNHVP